MTYDLVIVGGGPAGTAAAVYAARKKLKTILITPEWGGQSIVSETIYNWIGTPTIAGAELADNLRKHVTANIGDALEVNDADRVKNITKKGELFSVETENEKTYETKTVLITAGSARRKLEVPGADRLEHRGLTYCASCDGPLFADQDVAVIGGGNAGFESAAQLMAYCKSVTLLHRSDTFKADEVTVEKVLSNPKVKAIKNVDILEVKGEKMVDGLVYKDKISGEVKELHVGGIFVEIGQIPNTDFVKNIVPLDEFGRIKINYANQRTETPGIWAAGDATNVLYHQNNIAAGDAVRAIEDLYFAIHTNK